jgi:hypothetical protein
MVLTSLESKVARFPWRLDRLDVLLIGCRDQGKPNRLCERGAWFCEEVQVGWP